MTSFIYLVLYLELHNSCITTLIYVWLLNLKVCLKIILFARWPQFSWPNDLNLNFVLMLNITHIHGLHELTHLSWYFLTGRQTLISVYYSDLISVLSLDL